MQKEGTESPTHTEVRVFKVFVDIRNLKMVQLYDTYTTASFSALIEKTDMTKYGDIVPFETAQIGGKLIVPCLFLAIKACNCEAPGGSRLQRTEHGQICPKAKNIPPKALIFSDFCRTFATSLMILLVLILQH